jgi:hypothetical protein
MASRKKGPPKQLWCVIGENGSPVSVHLRKKDADASDLNRLHVAGPYILAERVRQK